MRTRNSVARFVTPAVTPTESRDPGGSSFVSGVFLSPTVAGVIVVQVEAPLRTRRCAGR